MQKYLIPALILLSLSSANAQGDTNVLRKRNFFHGQMHEFKFDLPTIWIGAAKIEYEYVMSPELTFGVSVLTNFGYSEDAILESDVLDRNYVFGFVRQYFYLDKRANPASGPYFGLHLGYYQDYFYEGSFAVGADFGWKFCGFKGLVSWDIYAGYGRLPAFAEDEEDMGPFYLRFGLCLGLRLGQ